MAMDDFMVTGEISLDGFTTVKSQFFARQIEPAMTIWNSAIGFNAPCFQALQRCEFVEMLINGPGKQIAIRPISSKDPNAINWLKGQKPEKATTTRLECTALMHPLFEKWNYDSNKRYRTVGRLVLVNRNLILLFDFNEATPSVIAKGSRDGEGV